MTAAEVTQIKNVLAKRGIVVDDGAVAVALLGLDVLGLEAEVNDRFHFELWDKQSAINGASAEYIKGRGDYADGAVYLVYQDGRVIVLQPHLPGVSGVQAMTDEQATAAAEAVVATLTERARIAALADAVAQKVGPNGVGN